MLVERLYSPNHSKNKRSKQSIKFIILHYTGMQSARASIKRMLSKSSKVSAHYLIDQKGKIFNLVSDDKTAWHAGKSKWKKIQNLNKCSIGIELVNRGHSINYENFKKKQLTSLVVLIKSLVKNYHIPFNNILGHSDIAPLRKLDPGEKFPWSNVLRKIFPNLKFNFHSNKQKKKREKVVITDKIRERFFYNLGKIGYCYLLKNTKNSQNDKVIKAFQSRFRQKKVDGNIDYECFDISNEVLKFFKKLDF